MVDNSIFSSRMKDQRIREKVSQAELGRLLGLSRSTISMYERGNREPSFEIVEQIAHALDCLPSYLMGWTDDPDAVYEKTFPRQNSGEVHQGEDRDAALAARERLRRSPGMRTLFDAVEDATEDELESYARMIKAFRGDDEQ